MALICSLSAITCQRGSGHSKASTHSSSLYTAPSGVDKHHQPSHLPNLGSIYQQCNELLDEGQSDEDFRAWPGTIDGPCRDVLVSAGVRNVIQSSLYQQGLDPDLRGMDFVASHFCKIAQVRTLARSLGICDV